MKLLILTEKESDLSTLLEHCGIDACRMNPAEAFKADLSLFDAYAILLPGRILDARLRARLEEENKKGKRVFAEAIGSFLDLYFDSPKNTAHSRLISLGSEGEGIDGLLMGDLLDEQSNLMQKPYFMYEDTVPLLVYKEKIVAHTHLDATREAILEGSDPGMWLCRESTVLMTSFRLQNFNKARFSPRAFWHKVIAYITRFLTGQTPAAFPESVVTFGVEEDLSGPSAFEACRRRALDQGIAWLKGFLVDDGAGGIREGLHHNVDPDGNQSLLKAVRTDCTGEAAGAFRMYATLCGDGVCGKIADSLEAFAYGPMVEKGGLCDGMMRWTEEAWGVCYQDDVARAILPTLYDHLFFGENPHFETVKKCLDFLVRTTALDGTREFRTDRIHLTEKSMAQLASRPHGCHSAHYNAYYSAALLLAYRICGDEGYLSVGERGLETLMSKYPDTIREQSETEEMCRLILPLSILYYVTGKEEHREMLYRVTRDLEPLRHPFGGYREWDTGYKAVRNRNAAGGECSVLTENGDPVADQLYSCNFLPLGFAFAHLATGDEWFLELWRGVVSFFIRTQLHSANPLTDGSWCRAFDMELKEPCAAPHDHGWATLSSETGWTCSEILMGMMLPDLIEKTKNPTPHKG